MIGKKIKNIFLNGLNIIISMSIYFVTISIAIPFMVIAKLFDLISGDINEQDDTKIIR